MFLPLLRDRRPKEVIIGPAQGRDGVYRNPNGTLFYIRGDGFTCPKCGRGNATKVCPVDGAVAF